jgi:membrane protein implicated in regulation of membrane protease activity
MSRQGTAAVYFVVTAAVIVAVDVLFFRGHLWERLMANAGIVLVSAVFYWRFLRRA